MRKYTKATLDREFPTDDACLDFLFNTRWPNGVTCKKCGKVTKHFRISGRKTYCCEFCGSQVSPTAHTIFHKSELPLRSWFYAIFLMAKTRAGIASMQLERELGVNHRTALRMFRQIRSLMGDGSATLFGAVEADETYIGGKRPGKRGRGAEGKTAVFGMVERGGKAFTQVTADVQAKTLLPIIQEHIPAAPGISSIQTNSALMAGSASSAMLTKPSSTPPGSTSTGPPMSTRWKACGATQSAG